MMKYRLSTQDKKALLRIGIAGLLTIFLLFLKNHFAISENLYPSIFQPDLTYWKFLVLFIIVYLIIAYDVLLSAFKNCLHGTIFDENFLMSIATIGAFLIGQYFEALAVMFFYQIGEFLQNYAVQKSRKSISDLMDISPEYANIMQNGQLVQVDPYEISVGDEIIVLPGERVPLDGIVSNGYSSLDTSALTGESLPTDVEPGSLVLSGCINLQKKIQLKVNKEFDDSTVSRILELVENASDQKADAEVFATTFARYYTPIVVISALLLALLPPFFLQQSFALWLKRALIFLVVSCPCALVVSVPLSFFGGIGAASRIGVLIKGSNYLEYLADLKTLVFDKTGTLTHGKFKLLDVQTNGISKNTLIEKAAYAESFSTHPIAKCIAGLAKQPYKDHLHHEIQEHSGMGVHVSGSDYSLLVGNDKLLKKYNVIAPRIDALGTVVHVAENGKYLGYLLIGDALKEDTRTAVKELREAGIHTMIMLTGDKKENAAKISQDLALDNYYAELLPQEKVEKLEQILKNKQKDGFVGYVGDGLNDAPVLAMADIGIAMGGVGSDAAIEAADIIIMQDQLSKITQAMHIAGKTMRIVKQNISFAILIKLAILILAIFGYATMWLAVFGDVGVTIIAVFNALRVFFGKTN